MLALDCPCGERIAGDDEDELVRLAQQHLERVHPGLHYSRDEILFLAVRIGERGSR